MHRQLAYSFSLRSGVFRYAHAGASTVADPFLIRGTQKRASTFRTMAPVPLHSSPLACPRLLAKTILIIEDEPPIALHLHAALHEAGAGLIAATTADEALKLIERNDVSAAIVDISLGGQDCVRVCEQLSGRRIPFAFHTGHPSAEVFRRWPEAPVFIKPTPADQLIAGIVALVATHPKGVGRI